MTDLKLIDELLCDIKQMHDLSWAEVEIWSSVTWDAMQRLRREWGAGRMPVITLGLANHFRATEKRRRPGNP